MYRYNLGRQNFLAFLAFSSAGINVSVPDISNSYTETVNIWWSYFHTVLIRLLYYFTRFGMIEIHINRIKKGYSSNLSAINPFLHNVVKWPNILLKSCGVPHFTTLRMKGLWSICKGFLKIINLIVFVKCKETQELMKLLVVIQIKCQSDQNYISAEQIIQTRKNILIFEIFLIN